MAAVQKLWQRKLPDGAEIEACLWHDSALSECTIELSVRAAVADALAANMADAIKAALDERGAQPFLEPEKA
jgi:hypothetical protein